MKSFFRDIWAKLAGMSNKVIKILDRYILRKFLGTYVFAILLIIIIVVIFDVVEKLDDFSELKAPTWDIIYRYYFNFIPFFINQFSGLFTFISVVFFTSKMAVQTEIVAILSGGVSFNRLMWPYFIGAFIIAFSSLILSTMIIPIANEKRIDFEAQYLKKGKRLSMVFDDHIYRQIDDGTFAYIRFFNGNNQTASFFAIEKYEEDKVVEILEASRASFNSESRRWKANKYTIRTFDGEGEVFENHEKLDTLINLDVQELGRVEELIKTMNSFELAKFIRQQQAKGSDMIPVFKVEQTQRISYPISTFILTLIGVSLSSRKVRGGMGLHIGIGIALCFSYILVARFAEEFAKGGVMPPVLSVWIPNILYGIVAVYLYIKAPK